MLRKCCRSACFYSQSHTVWVLVPLCSSYKQTVLQKEERDPTRENVRLPWPNRPGLQGIEEEDGDRVQEELGSGRVVVPLHHDEVLHRDQ